jgi:hypothetical protein
MSLFFNIILEHVAAAFSCWQQFKNIIAVEIGLLNSQPFTNGNLNFFVTAESATSQVLAFASCYLYAKQASLNRGSAKGHQVFRERSSHSRLLVFILIMITKAIYSPYLEFTTYIKNNICY